MARDKTLKDSDRAHRGAPGSQPDHGQQTRYYREAQDVRLAKTHGPDTRADDETAHKQDWEITDHKGRTHKFTASTGLEQEPKGKGLGKRFHVNGEKYTAGSLIHHAVTGSYPASDGESAPAKDVVNPDPTGR